MAQEISRRHFVQAMAAAGLSACGASVLAACSAPPPTAAPMALPTAAPATATATAAPATAAPTAAPNPDLTIELMELDLPDGRVLEVRSTGPKGGEILLLHHGTPGAGLPFVPWVEAAVARGLRTVMYSRPGYGKSSSLPGRKVVDAAADVARVLDAFGAKTFRTIGVSGGGPHALACAATLPDRCLATAAVSSLAPYPAAGIDWFAGMCQDNLSEYRLALQGAAALKPVLAGVVPTPRPEDVKDHPHDCWSGPDSAWVRGAVGDYLMKAQQLGLANGTDGWRDDDLAHVSDWGFDLGAARGVAIWHGKQDVIVPSAHGVWLADHIPGARLHLLASEGHLSTAFKAFKDILDDLLNPAR